MNCPNRPKCGCGYFCTAREKPEGDTMSIESRTCEHVEALGGVDTPAEREAFLKWWEGQAGWTGSPCAVAYQGWLARAALIPKETE